MTYLAKVGKKPEEEKEFKKSKEIEESDIGMHFLDSNSIWKYEQPKEALNPRAPIFVPKEMKLNMNAKEYKSIKYQYAR